MLSIKVREYNLQYFSYRTNTLSILNITEGHSLFKHVDLVMTNVLYMSYDDALNCSKFRGMAFKCFKVLEQTHCLADRQIYHYHNGENKMFLPADEE